MGEKSARKEGGKTAPAKTLKEKRTAKADKTGCEQPGGEHRRRLQGQEPLERRRPVRYDPVPAAARCPMGIPGIRFGLWRDAAPGRHRVSVLLVPGVLHWKVDTLSSGARVIRGALAATHACC